MDERKDFLRLGSIFLAEALALDCGPEIGPNQARG
jgi:hypothetical protein